MRICVACLKIMPEYRPDKALTCSKVCSNAYYHFGSKKRIDQKELARLKLEALDPSKKKESAQRKKKGCGEIYDLVDKSGAVTGHAKCGDQDRRRKYFCPECKKL